MNELKGEKKQALVLFTSRFPYYSSDITPEQGLMQIEVEYLAEAFHPFIIAPNTLHENKYKLPDGVEIDTSWSAVHQATIENRLYRLLSGPLFLLEVLSHPRLWLKPGIVRRLARTALRAFAIRDWVIELFQKRGLDPGNTIFYTYWFGNIPLGIGLAKQKLPSICLVSRAHGGDLYADRWPLNYFSYRPQTLRLLDRLFLISEHGRTYITGAYPSVANFCEVSRLGIRDSHALNSGSSDGVFRIASCSSLYPVKHIDLLILGIAQAALERPNQLFEWNHLGGGIMYDEIKFLAARNLPANVSWHFHGNLPNEEVIRFYRENPIDLFANVSSSEGIPVSIMEAASFGIPIMATAVGGTPEIVSEKNGKLLSPDPSPREISTALLDLLDQPQFRVRAGAFSRQIWQSDYDAEQNFPRFVSRLKSVRTGN